MASTSGDASVCYRLCADVVTRDIDEGVLVVNLDTGKTWKLNHVGAAVIQGLDLGTDLERITATLTDHYRVASEVIRRDVDALIENLHREGLIEPMASP